MEVEFWNRLKWLCCFFSLYFVWIFQGVQANRGGFLYFQFLCYRNPGHLDSSGRSCDSIPTTNCDPFFAVCISNRYILGDIVAENCPIFYMNTSPYDNQESVCDKPYDSRGVLGNLVIKELPFPFQKTIYVKIQIRDSDGWKNYQDLIASFSAEFIQTPSFNYSTPVYKEISMFRNEHRYGNPRASLRIALALQCEKDRFGDYCLTFCRATQTSSYICSKDGNKICKEGWKGENCLEVDVCVFQACIEGAQCIVVNGEAKCMCNGEIGPQCSPNYNPCLKNPCENQGRCIPNKTHEAGVRCQCQSPFHGSRCESKIDFCALEPCHNNATCEYYGNHVRRCVCLEGFSGFLCDHKIYNTNGTSESIDFTTSPQINRARAVTILSISLAISLVVFVAVILIYFFRKRNKKKYKIKKKSEITVNMVDLDKRLNNPSTVSNEYVVKTAPETIYETVNDRDTYAYLIEKNDEYLVPSRPTTPGFASTPGAGSTVYLDMFNTFDTNTLPSDTPIPNRDSLDLPPLPTREHKRRLSLKVFCVK